MQNRDEMVETTKRKPKDIFKFVRSFAYFLEIIVFFTLQRIPESLIYFITGARPIYLIPIALSIATLEKKRIGILFSLLAGAMIDTDSSYKLGFYTVLLPTISIILNIILNEKLQINSFTSVFLILVSVLVICLLELLVFSIFSGAGLFAFDFTNFYLKRLLCTLVSVPIFYFFNKSIFLFLEK